MSISIPNPLSAPSLERLLGGRQLGTRELLAAVTLAGGGFVAWEQLRFWYKRWRRGGKLVPGPSSVTPFLGGLVEMVMDPYAFWERQKETAGGTAPGYSYNSLFGKFILTVLHPSAKFVLGANNLAFTHGTYHKHIRKSFLSLFTRKALSTYVELQDVIIQQHIAEWLQLPGEFEIRSFVRDMNAQTSQDVFVGPYIDNEEERAKFSQAYREMTEAFLAFPLPLPGTAVWKGRQARFYLFGVLERASHRALEHIKLGGEPRCLLDYWAQKCLEEIAEAEAEGRAPPAHTTADRMGDAMLDFLFASQDASTASLVWTTVLMAEHPEILAKVREEQLRVRKDPAARLNGEALNEMTYTRQARAGAGAMAQNASGQSATGSGHRGGRRPREPPLARRGAPAVPAAPPPPPQTPHPCFPPCSSPSWRQVVKEVLRYRAPAPMMAYTNYPLTEDYSIPKGTLVFPSINAANMQARPAPPHAPSWHPAIGAPALPCRAAPGPATSGSAEPCALHGASRQCCAARPGRARPAAMHNSVTRSAALQGFTDGTRFDPDRFSPERKEDLKFAKNMLTFGWGPHYCVGKEYATNHLMCYLALLSTTCDWSRRRTPDSDKWLYLPTIYPADSLVTLSRRGPKNGNKH
eukprot:scaffold4.g4786.t1